MFFSIVIVERARASDVYSEQASDFAWPFEHSILWWPPAIWNFHHLCIQIERKRHSIAMFVGDSFTDGGCCAKIISLKTKKNENVLREQFFSHPHVDGNDRDSF